jgi:hypothetical protein
MPIIEPTRSNTPLTQGDILSGITLFVTREGWGDTGGDAGKAATKLCVVLSRPCVAAHKKHIVVAGIDKVNDKVPREVESFETVLNFLNKQREGERSPDLFYVGQLPGRSGRFCARLDLLFTIEVPSEPFLRQQFLEQRRLATLHPDFARDLHLRLFNAFASLGFDDHDWLSTDDLEWLVTQGKADLAAAQQAVLQLEALKASRTAEGAQFNESDLTNARKRLEVLRDRVKPFEQDLAKRRAEPGA